MKTKILRNIFLSVGVLFASAQLLPAVTFTTFDPPGSTFTQPSGINPVGAITGTYFDASFVGHGFLRAPDGTFTTIDPPGTTTTWIGFFEGLVGPPINPAGAITGTYFDTSGAGHGFLRAPDGTITTFDAPGSTFTIAQGINAAGTIAGFYNFIDGHGFLRAPDGTFTTFDVPSAVNGTYAGGINLAGTIAGLYFDASFVFHGFLRAPEGTITTFDPPGSTFTFPTGINPAGAIVGFYFDASGAEHGFLRAPDGTFTTFDTPGAVNGTQPSAINPKGVITGLYSDASGTPHGFLRIP